MLALLHNLSNQHFFINVDVIVLLLNSHPLHSTQLTRRSQRSRLLLELNLEEADVELEGVERESAVGLEFGKQEFHAFDVRFIVFVVEAEKTSQGSGKIGIVLSLELLVKLTCERLLMQGYGHLRNRIALRRN